MLGNSDIDEDIELDSVSVELDETPNYYYYYNYYFDCYYYYLLDYYYGYY